MGKSFAHGGTRLRSAVGASLTERFSGTSEFPEARPWGADADVGAGAGAAGAPALSRHEMRRAAPRGSAVCGGPPRRMSPVRGYMVVGVIAGVAGVSGGPRAAGKAARRAPFPFPDPDPALIKLSYRDSNSLPRLNHAAASTGSFPCAGCPGPSTKSK